MSKIKTIYKKTSFMTNLIKNGKWFVWTQLIEKLADTLTPIYGNSYSMRNLDYYKKFYLLFPDAEIVNTHVHNLDWLHICE